jgi:hypothetical protein
MNWLLRKSVAIVAIYSITLQILLSGFIFAKHVGVEPIAVICAAEHSGAQNSPLPQPANDCDACPIACAGAALGLTPPRVIASFVFFADRPQRLTLWIGVLAPRQNHQPQASRAPPIPA